MLVLSTSKLTTVSLISQSNSKRVYETLQENNDTLKENNRLLKKLLKKVVQNDKTVHRHSLVEYGQSVSTGTGDAKLNEKSERMSQFLADVESILSSTPSSTPRVSVASKEALGGDEELQSLRASFYELGSKFSNFATQNDPGYLPDFYSAGDGEMQGLEGSFQGLWTADPLIPHPESIPGVAVAYTPKSSNSNDEPLVKTNRQIAETGVLFHILGDQTSNPSDLETFLHRQANVGPKPMRLPREIEAQINAAMKDADEAPQEIKSLRTFAKHSPKSAQHLITSYYQCECNDEAEFEIGWTSIFVAIALGKLNTAMMLRKRGAKIDRHWLNALPSALQLAVLCNDHATVRWLVEEGVNVNAKGCSSRTPLQNAMLADNIKMMELLLSRGADIWLTDSQGFSVVGLAEVYAKPAILRSVLSRLRSSVTACIWRSTLLHYAAWIHDTEAIRWFIQKGSDVNAKNEALQTPLHMALFLVEKEKRIGGAETKAIDLLLASGADPTCRDHENKTPLHHASDLGRWDAFRLLLDVETDMNAKREDQLTPTQMLFPEDVR